MPVDMLDDVEFKVAKLDLGPDDILAVRVTRPLPLSDVIATELTARLERRLDLAGRVLVLDASADLSVIARNDAPRDAPVSLAARPSKR